MNNIQKTKLNTLELFVGCGGLLDGFEQTGLYSTLAGVEWKESARKTLINRLENKYRYRDAKDRIVHFDIQRVNELINGWKNDIQYSSNDGLNSIVSGRNIDLIVGGPPCQAYSLAGRIQDKDGMKLDYRNYLFESYLKIVGIYKPKIIVFENVEGMLSAKPDGISIIDKIKSEFNAYGYDIVEDIRKYALINFTDYGVPQKRKRVILIGLSRNHFPDKKSNQNILIDFYTNILTKFKSDKIFTVRDALYELTPFYPLPIEEKNGSKKYSHKPVNTELNSHIPRYHNKRDIEIFRILADDIEKNNNIYTNTEALKNLYKEKTGKFSNVHKYSVLKWDEPSNTIPAHLKKDGLRHIHPDPKQARTITVREAARLQTFDDDFEFISSMVDNYEMIGNAVPPKFAKKLAYALYELLSKYQLIDEDTKTIHQNN